MGAAHRGLQWQQALDSARAKLRFDAVALDGNEAASAMMQPQNYALLPAGATLTAEGRLAGNRPLGKRGCIERLAG